MISKAASHGRPTLSHPGSHVPFHPGAWKAPGGTLGLGRETETGEHAQRVTSTVHGLPGWTLGRCDDRRTRTTRSVRAIPRPTERGVPRQARAVRPTGAAAHSRRTRLRHSSVPACLRWLCRTDQLSLVPGRVAPHAEATRPGLGWPLVPVTDTPVLALCPTLSHEQGAPAWMTPEGTAASAQRHAEPPPADHLPTTTTSPHAQICCATPTLTHCHPRVSPCVRLLEVAMAAHRHGYSKQGTANNENSPDLRLCTQQTRTARRSKQAVTHTFMINTASDQH